MNHNTHQNGHDDATLSPRPNESRTGQVSVGPLAEDPETQRNSQAHGRRTSTDRLYSTSLTKSDDTNDDDASDNRDRSSAAAADKLEAKLRDEEWHSQAHGHRPNMDRLGNTSLTKSNGTSDDDTGGKHDGSAAAAAEKLEMKLLEEEWNDKGRL